MRLAVFGTGYVGLVTGTCFSELGHDVICVDIDEEKIDSLNGGEVPIFEPGLKELVSTNREQGRLRFTTDAKTAIESSLVIFIAVGTPALEDGTADLQYVLSVAETIGEYMDGYRVIVDKSTVPVGTARKVQERVQEALDERGEKFEFNVVSNPEFLKEGAAIDDFMAPDRVVLGSDDEWTFALMKELYSHFAKNNRPIICMSTESAEMTKYAANAMLATKISFINEIAGICERVGANIDEVRRGIGSDSRIGYRFIYPGIGYGGSCFPKDVKALRNTAREAGIEPRLLGAVDDVNETQKSILLEKIRTYYRDDLEGKTFAVWGLSFKPETDDVREAPALVMIEALAEAGAAVRAYDPKAIDETRRTIGEIDGVSYFDSYYVALEGCDALIIATEWSFFLNPDFERMTESMKASVIFDGRNIYDPSVMERNGFDYFSIGRQAVSEYSKAD
ncbi:MAG TPA: UDP-glucose/GDP-mannose dehydrogenase family protein [Candidatus Hydrogenedentes bacterium]|nr:UDP-glucose/GDP-mannose dehydrogenase family protein [Candidatus Hydrogenedentota bacterium]